MLLSHPTLCPNNSHFNFFHNFFCFTCTCTPYWDQSLPGLFSLSSQIPLDNVPLPPLAMKIQYHLHVKAPGVVDTSMQREDYGEGSWLKLSRSTDKYFCKLGINLMIGYFYCQNECNMGLGLFIGNVVNGCSRLMDPGLIALPVIRVFSQFSSLG